MPVAVMSSVIPRWSQAWSENFLPICEAIREISWAQMRPMLYLLGGKGWEETSSGGNLYQEPFKKKKKKKHSRDTD